MSFELIHLFKIYIFLTLHIYIFWVWYMCMIYMHISLAFMWCLLDRLVYQWIFSTCLTQRLTDPACVLSCFSRVRLCATLWTVTCRALSWDSPGKNTGAGSHSLLQGVFPTQGLKPGLLCLLHRQVLYLPQHHVGRPLAPLGHSPLCCIDDK